MLLVQTLDTYVDADLSNIISFGAGTSIYIYLHIGTGIRFRVANGYTIDNVSLKVGQNWTFGTGWSINDGKVYFDNPTGSEFRQSLATSAGKYRISFDLDIKSGTNTNYLASICVLIINNLQYRY